MYNAPGTPTAELKNEVRLVDVPHAQWPSEHAQQAPSASAGLGYPPTVPNTSTKGTLETVLRRPYRATLVCAFFPGVGDLTQVRKPTEWCTIPCSRGLFCQLFGTALPTVRNCPAVDMSVQGAVNMSLQGVTPTQVVS